MAGSSRPSGVQLGRTRSNSEYSQGSSISGVFLGPQQASPVQRAGLRSQQGSPAGGLPETIVEEEEEGEEEEEERAATYGTAHFFEVPRHLTVQS